jgi:hypothetical protein
LAWPEPGHLRAWGWGRESDGATDVQNPGGGVELGVEAAELVATGTDDGWVGAGLGGIEDGDAVGGGDLEADVGGPAEDDDAVGGDGVDGEDVQADGWLSALAGDVCLWAGEGGAACRGTDQEVDRVREVDERGGEQVGGDVDVECRQGRHEVVDDLHGRVVWDALLSASSGSGQAEQAEGSEDGGETLFWFGLGWFGLGWIRLIENEREF